MQSLQLPLLPCVHPPLPLTLKLSLGSWDPLGPPYIPLLPVAWTFGSTNSLRG